MSTTQDHLAKHASILSSRAVTAQLPWAMRTCRKYATLLARSPLPARRLRDINKALLNIENTILTVEVNYANRAFGGIEDKAL